MRYEGEGGRSRAALGISIIVTLVICAGCAQPTPPIPRPDVQQLESQVRTYIEQYIAWAEEDPTDAQRHASLGVVYEANELWSEARVCFRAVTRLAPEEVLARYHEAVACQELGDLDRTVELLHGVVLDDPEFAAAHHRLGRLLLEANEVDQAVGSFRRSIDLMPDHVEGYLGMANSMLRAGDLAAAEAYARQALEINGRQPMAWFLLGQAMRNQADKRAEATRALRAGAGASVTYLPDPWSVSWPIHAKGLADQMRLAHDLSVSGQSAKAVEVLEEALAYRPGNTDVLNNLAVIVRRAGRPDTALGYLEQAQRAKPDGFATYINISACLLDLHRLPDSLKAADRAISLFPMNAQAHVTRARVLLAQHRLDEALASAQQARDLASDDALTYLTLADVLLQRSDAQSALSACEKAAELSPLSLEPELCRWRLLSALGRSSDAAAVLRKANALHGADPRLRRLEVGFEPRKFD